GGTLFNWIGGKPDFRFLTGGPGTRTTWTPFSSTLNLRRVNGELLLTVQIRDWHGNTVVDIVDNNWTISSHGASWEKNYTDNALEVLDERKRVVLQVQVYDDR